MNAASLFALPYRATSREAEGGSPRPSDLRISSPLSTAFSLVRVSSLVLDTKLPRLQAHAFFKVVTDVAETLSSSSSCTN